MREIRPGWSPASLYGISKRLAEHYLEYFRGERGLDYTTSRSANVYGPRQEPRGEAGVMAIFADQMLKGEQPTIYGDGEETRDFVFVGDVSAAFVAALDGALGRTINIATGRETSVDEVFRVLARLIGFPGSASYAPARPGEVRRSALAVDRARTELG